MSVPRRTTVAARLARLGFADPARAELLIADLAVEGEQAEDALIDALSSAADPDLALAALTRMPRDAELARALAEDPLLRARLAAVLGASAALGDHLARHPGDWRVLAGADDLPAPAAEQVRAELLDAVGARPEDPEPVAGGVGGRTVADGAVAGRAAPAIGSGSPGWAPTAVRSSARTWSAAGPGRSSAPASAHQ